VSNLTPAERILALTDKHKLSADDQLALLRVIDHTSQEDFETFITSFDEELTTPLSATAPPATAEMPKGSEVACMEAFFDRNLARASLKKLVPLLADGVLYERIGYDTARLVVPQAEMATYTDILGRGLGFESNVAAPGDIAGGWYHTFADGAVAAIAIVNAAPADGGAYIDAFLILQEGVHPTVPNPSLPPCKRLDEDFVFPYPDGTYKVVRLVPSTV